jgi:hypothetical protein
MGQSALPVQPGQQWPSEQPVPVQHPSSWLQLFSEQPLPQHFLPEQLFALSQQLVLAHGLEQQSLPFCFAAQQSVWSSAQQSGVLLYMM